MFCQDGGLYIREYRNQIMNEEELSKKSYQTNKIKQKNCKIGRTLETI